MRGFTRGVQIFWVRSGRAFGTRGDDHLQPGGWGGWARVKYLYGAGLMPVYERLPAGDSFGGGVVVNEGKVSIRVGLVYWSGLTEWRWGLALYVFGMVGGWGGGVL